MTAPQNNGEADTMYALFQEIHCKWFQLLDEKRDGKDNCIFH